MPLTLMSGVWPCWLWRRGHIDMVTLALTWWHQLRGHRHSQSKSEPLNSVVNPQLEWEFKTHNTQQADCQKELWETMQGELRTYFMGALFQPVLLTVVVFCLCQGSGRAGPCVRPTEAVSSGNVSYSVFRLACSNSDMQKVWYFLWRVCTSPCSHWFSPNVQYATKFILRTLLSPQWLMHTWVTAG